MLTSAESRAFAQAEAAPESYEPPPNLSMSPDPRVPPPNLGTSPIARWTLELNARLVVAMGTPAGLPRIGFGAGGSIGRALIVFGRFRFGVGITFAYERVQRSESTIMIGSTATFNSLQYLSQASFSADLRFDGFFANGLVRPWLTLGPGFSLGDYQSAPDMNDKITSKFGFTGAVRFGAGIGFRVWHNVELGPRVEVLPTFGGPSVGTPGAAVFQPGNFAAALDLGFRF